MFGIALRYGVSLEELMNANPTVMPNAMSVGTVLIIPGVAPQPVDSETPASASTVTPLPIMPGRLFCTPTREGGVWCALPVTNTQGFPLEALIAVIRLEDTQTGEVFLQNAYPALDLLPTGKTQPLTTYFAAPMPDSFQTSAQIVSALPSPEDGRYLAARLDNQTTLFSEDRLSAEINLDVSLDGGDAPAQRVWVAAAAYNLLGDVIGVRRWENPDGQQLLPGQTLAVHFNVYSNAGPIDRVELTVEARP